MKDRELIDAMIAETLPRIKDIRDDVSRKAADSAQAMIDAGEWPALAGLKPAPPDPAMEAEISRFVWGAPLTDLAVRLLWAAQKLAADGTFVVDEASVAAACATIDDAEIKRSTGIDIAHVRIVLEKMAEAFIGIVRAQGVIELTIDRQPLVFRAAAA